MSTFECTGNNWEMVGGTPPIVEAGPWGVWDAADRCWMGNDDGPLVYPERAMAQISAQMMEQMLFGTDLNCRLTPRTYDGTGNKLRDKVDARCTPLQALQRIEAQADPTPAPSKEQG